MKTAYWISATIFIVGVISLALSIVSSESLDLSGKFLCLGVLGIVVSALMICVAIWEEDLPTEEEKHC